MKVISTKPTFGLTKEEKELINDFRILLYKIQNTARDEANVIIENFDVVDNWIPVFMGEELDDEIDFIEI